MKGYIKTLTALLFLLSSFGNTFAAGALDHFEVILGKESGNVGEALDITISAVDRNNEIVTDYIGDILVFSESDAEAEFPNELSENSYSFTTADQGSVKFENAVKFKNAGKQDIFVYDLNDDSVLGVAEIDIAKKEVLQNVEIEIISPEEGVTHGKDSVTVSGSTTKNHQIQIILNGEEDIFTTTNTDGIFEKEIENLPDGTNAIQALILNADGETIGDSQVVQFKVNSAKPEFKSIIISPEGEVETESVVSVQVVSNTGLSSAQVVVDDVITDLSEEKEGIYLGTFNAPANAGNYPIDVILKNEFTHETNIRDASSLNVISLPELTAATSEEVQEVKPEIKNTNGPDLSIKNIEVTELKSKSIITWDEVETATSYNIYKKSEDGAINLVENISEARFEVEITGDEIVYEDFAIKALAENTETQEEIQGDLSEMTKVKTGAELYIFLAMIALLLSAGIMFIRREA